MCSDQQGELYTEFEPDANEVMFGQRTAPDRSLKLVDQKSKFELIELMRGQQEQSNALNVHSLSTSTIPSTYTHARTVPSNYYVSQSCCDYNPELQFLKPLQNKIGTSPGHPKQKQLNNHRNQPNPNFILLSNGSLRNNEKKNTLASKGSSIPIKISSVTISTSKTKPQHSVNLSSQGASTLQSHFEPKRHKAHSASLPSDNSIVKNAGWLQQKDPITQQYRKAFPSSSKEIMPKNNSTLTVEKSLTPTGPFPSKTTKRRQEQYFSAEFRKKILLINEKAVNEKAKAKANISNISVGKSFAETNSANIVEVKSNSSVANVVDAKSVIDLTIDQSKSTEWNAMDRLVTNLFRNRSNNWEQLLSPSELQLKNEILIQMSINPNAIPTNSDVRKVRQKVGEKTFGEFINECKIIMVILGLTSKENQAYFYESQKKLVDELKELYCRRDFLKFRGVESKVANLICMFLCPGKDLVKELIKDPQTLQSNELIKKEIAAKGQSIDDVMKSIKCALDEFVPVRLPKKFHLPIDRFMDVPFVVNLYHRSLKMTKDSATELTKVLFTLINCLNINPKPSIRDIKFKDSSLKILCLNCMSFDWLKNTISDHHGVDIRPIKNVISKNQLKTIRLKFERPQYLHFNYLMEQLKVDNPRLLTRRWEFRSPRPLDATKWMYVGVDVESLIILEEMNRVGTLRGSKVTFEISYADNQENFEKMTLVTKKMHAKYKVDI